MKFTKFLKCAVLTAVAGTGLASLSACKGGTTKIGVIVADVSGEEALGFRSYVEDYLAKQYDVEVVYSPAIADEAGAKSEVQKMIGQNCKAIIDMADKNRGAMAKLCNENKVYYAIGSGVMSDTDFEASKGLKYFVGQIGPSNETEYETGLAMGRYYKETKNVSKVGIYGAFVPNPMHLYRLAGLITGLGDTYKSVSGQNIVYTVFGDGGQFDGTQIAGDVEVSYCAGMDNEGAVFGIVDSIAKSGIDAFLSVGMATTFFTSVLNGANVEYSDIDSFTSSNGTNMQTGSLKYLAGKYSSSLGPIFAAIMSAVKGKAIRTESGEAFSIGQGYWTATTYEEFQRYQAADSVTNPIFNKTVIDQLIGADYATFKAAVELDRTPRN